MAVLGKMVPLWGKSLALVALSSGFLAKIAWIRPFIKPQNKKIFFLANHRPVALPAKLANAPQVRLLAVSSDSYPKITTAMTVIRLTPDQFREKAAETPGILLDVRTPSEFEGGHIEGAANLDFLGGVFAEQFAELDPAQTYYLYCASGNRSGKSALLMIEAGYSAYNVGGFQELASAGFPTEY
jgi:phage shock protein E